MTGAGADAGAGHGSEVSALLAQVPLYAPADTGERGRISATSSEPGADVPSKVVVDFGWHSERARLDLEIATRRFPDSGLAAGSPASGGDSREDPDGAARRLRMFCAEREFLERRTHGLADWSSTGLPEGAEWSSTELAVDGEPRRFTVLHTSHAWVAAAAVQPPYLVRLFAPVRPEGLHALHRITAPEELEPVRGRG